MYVFLCINDVDEIFNSLCPILFNEKYTNFLILYNNFLCYIFFK